MHTTQHNTRCPVYLHPAAATSPASIEAIQRQTGLVVIINVKRPAARAVTTPDHDGNPWGGDAA
jgi:hypothetical protein